jgi:hypothetical protein
MCQTEKVGQKRHVIIYSLFGMPGGLFCNLPVNSHLKKDPIFADAHSEKEWANFT